jgi:glucokinase
VGTAKVPYGASEFKAGEGLDLADGTQYLVADVGGTNTRIALGGADGALHDLRSFKNDDVKDLAALVGEVLAGAGKQRPRFAALAVAGPVDGDEIRLTNRPWKFSRSAVREALALDELVVVNDFLAVAHALPALAAEDLWPLEMKTAPARGNLLACGPGTGFGAAALVRSGREAIAISSEAGHMRLGAATAEEAKVIGRLACDRGAVAVEDVLSGRGLVAVHRILSGRETTTDAIIAAAKKGESEARATMDFFMTVFGRVAGDLALAFDCRSGVFIAGGLGQALVELYAGAPFNDAFREHPPYQERLAAIPIFVVMHPFPGLIGAQQIALARLHSDSPVRTP